MAVDAAGNWINPDTAGSSSNIFAGGGGGGISSKTFDYAGGAVSDLFAARAHRAKAEGDIFEQRNYMLAAGLADQNAIYAVHATAIKQMQADRELYKSIGGTTSDIAGAGFAATGSALDILRQSAAEGAITHAVLGEQGQIQEAGYKEQATSYRNMAAAAQVAIDAENDAARGAQISAGLKGAAAGATIGAVGGPIGVGVGAVVGGAAGLFTRV